MEDDQIKLLKEMRQTHTLAEQLIERTKALIARWRAEDKKK